MRSEKIICFNVKKNNISRERNIVQRQTYKKNHPAVSFSTRRLLCRYKNILQRRNWISDVSSYITSDPLFPLNAEEFDLLLQRNQYDGKVVLTALSSLVPNNDQLTMLNDLRAPMQANNITLQIPLIEGLISCKKFMIKVILRVLNSNLDKCVDILTTYNDNIHLMTTNRLVRDLECYIGSLRTVCAFMYLIIFKESSHTVNQLLPEIPKNRVLYCDYCRKDESTCQCMEGNESSSSHDSCSSYFDNNEVESSSSHDSCSSYFDNNEVEDRSKPLENDLFRITTQNSFFMSEYLAQFDDENRLQLSNELRSYNSQHAANMPGNQEQSHFQYNRFFFYDVQEDSTDTGSTDTDSTS